MKRKTEVQKSWTLEFPDFKLDYSKSDEELMEDIRLNKLSLEEFINEVTNF